MTHAPMTSAPEGHGPPRWLSVVDRLSFIGAAVGGIATACLMLHIAADVIGRQLFNHPLPGTLDLTQYVWMPSLISLGLGYALLRGEHIRVNLLTAPTGPKTQRVIEIVSMTFSLATVALFLLFGVEKAIGAMGFGERSVGTAWLAIWPYRWILVIGLVIFSLQIIASLTRAIVAREFVPDDADEGAAALLAEETVFDELGSEETILTERTDRSTVSAGKEFDR